MAFMRVRRYFFPNGGSTYLCVACHEIIVYTHGVALVISVVVFRAEAVAQLVDENVLENVLDEVVAVDLGVDDTRVPVVVLVAVFSSRLTPRIALRAVAVILLRRSPV